MRNRILYGNQQNASKSEAIDRSRQFPKVSRVPISFFSLLYLLMLVYGTLYPLIGWKVPYDGFYRHFLEVDMSKLSMTDMITNVLVYIPAGFLWAGILSHRISWLASVLFASLMGLGLSFSLEAIQVFLPARTSAMSDLLLNGLGAAIGGGAALLLLGETRSGLRLRNFRNDIFEPGALTNIGLIVLGFWALSQLSPLVPSLTVSNLRDGLKPLWYTVTGQSLFVTAQSAVYFCNIIALGGIFLSMSRSRRAGLILFTLILTLVLLMKVPVLSRQLSLEALLGSAGALVVLTLFHRISARYIITCVGCFLVAGYVVDALQESTYSTQVLAFNWSPFKGHMQNIVGLANILASGWVFLGLGYVVRYLSGPKLAVVSAVIGALLVVGLTSLMEVFQLAIPGRVPDVTDVLIAVIAWACAWVGKTYPAQAAISRQLERPAIDLPPNFR